MQNCSKRITVTRLWWHILLLIPCCGCFLQIQLLVLDEILPLCSLVSHSQRSEVRTRCYRLFSKSQVALPASLGSVNRNLITRKRNSSQACFEVPVNSWHLKEFTQNHSKIGRNRESPKKNWVRPQWSLFFWLGVLSYALILSRQVIHVWQFSIKRTFNWLEFPHVSK